MTIKSNRIEVPGRRNLAATAGVLLGISMGASIATAGEMLESSKAVVPAPESDESFYDHLWGYTTLYKDPNNSVIQKLSFTGRYQGDYSIVDGSPDAEWDGYNTRRLRAGLKAQLFQDFTLHGEVDLNPDGGDFYTRMTDAYLAWSQDDAFEFKIGKQSMPFTLDGATSSKELLTIDRNNLSNNIWFPYEYLPGVSVSGVKDNWVYHTGLYSAGSESPEFGNFDGGGTFLASLGYDFHESFDSDEALLRFDYVYQDPNENNTFTRSLENVGSINFNYLKNDFGIRTDLGGSTGYFGQPDLWGFVLMPYYNITDKLQFVTRYTYINSEGDNGIRFTRYESEAVSGRGNEYQEGFLGFNYYLYGNKLKLQTGVTYADMEDSTNDGGAYNGWGWTGALRISW